MKLSHAICNCRQAVVLFSPFKVCSFSYEFCSVHELISVFVSFVSFHSSKCSIGLFIIIEAISNQSLSFDEIEVSVCEI